MHLIRFAAVVALTLGGAAQAPALEIEVPGDFGTIQEAVDNAEDGDIVRVAAGVYEENVRIIDRSGIELIGEGMPSIDGGGGLAALVIEGSSDISVSEFTLMESARRVVGIEDSQRITLSLLKIASSGETGLELRDTSEITLSNLKIVDVGGDCIEAEGDEFGTVDSTIESCRLKRCGDEGIDLEGDNNLVENNVVVKSEADGIRVSSGIGNQIVGNFINRPGGDGIDVNSKFNTLEQNRVTGARRSGFDISARRNVLSKNIAKKSGKCGLKDSVGGRKNTYEKNKFGKECVSN